MSRIKTVLRRLLSKYGYLSIEMMSAISDDEKQDDSEDIRDTEYAEAKEIVEVNEETGEIKKVETSTEDKPTDNPFD